MGYVRPINPEILEWFLNRKLDDWDWIKEVSEEELDAQLNDLNPVPTFTVPLYKHQKAMFLLGTRNSNFMYWADMGLGKARLALELINWRHKNKPSLFVSPDSQNIFNILDEVNKFVPHLKAIPIYGTIKEKRERAEQEGDIYIISYIGLQHLLNSNTKGRSIKITPHDIALFGSKFNTVSYDEIVWVKSYKSITYNICKELSKYIPYRYGFTGWPINRDLLELWTQFYVIDGGNTLGKNFTTYQQSYFKSKILPFGVKWSIDRTKKPKLIQTVKNKTIYYSSSECQDLPSKISVPIYIKMGEEAKTYYNKIKEQLLESLTDESEDTDWINKIRNPFIKWRQICSGYLKVDEREWSEEKQKEVTISSTELSFENPKEAMLEQIISSLPLGSKLIIFYDLTPSGQRIVNKLKELKIGHTWLYGETKNKPGTITKFKTDPKCRVLVVNSKSGAVGLNLQVANYTLFYENPLSGMVKAQAIKRTWRNGQTDTVYIYEFIVKNSVEERIMEFLKEGEDLFHEIVEGKEVEGDSLMFTSFLHSMSLNKFKQYLRSN